VSLCLQYPNFLLHEHLFKKNSFWATGQFVSYVSNGETGYLATFWPSELKRMHRFRQKCNFFLINIVIICHELGLNRPVSASSDSLFQGLPSCLRRLCLQFRITFGIHFLFILVICSRFDLYPPSFSSSASALNSSRIS